MDSHECAATKRCSKCLVVKEESEFYRSKGKLTSHCRKCYAIASRKTYEANRGKRLKQCSARREANKEAVKKWMADYYLRNKDAILERTKAYQSQEHVKQREVERHKKRWLDNRDELLPKRKARYENDPEAKKRWLEYLKEHYRRNKPRYLAKWANRRAKLIKATPQWSDLRAIEAIYEQCKNITESTGIQHEVDHIVPLVSDVVCGLHVPDNLQIITLEANRSKSNKFG